MADTPTDFPGIPGYAIETLAGEGGNGSVYRAARETDSRTVAVKVLREPAPATAEHLRSEFRLLSHLQHPSLVAVHDFGYTDDGRPFFSMDWVDGQVLTGAHLRDSAGKLDEAAVLELIYHVTAALEFVHGRHLAHGDLKPGNIMLPQDGTPSALRLMDFGISALAGVDRDGISGTIEYMAPEIIRGEGSSPAADLYALGCILFELLTGSPPFTGDSAVDVLRAHLRDEAPALPDEASGPWTEWISTLLQKQPQLRYRTAFQLHALSAEALGRDTALSATTDTPVLRLLDIPRDQEHARARELYAASRATSCVLSIEGGAGSGKTRFIRDLLSAIQFEGGAVARVDVRPDMASFEPVLRMLSARCAGVDADSTALRVLAAEFPEYFPDVAADGIEELADDRRRLRLFHAAASLCMDTLELDVLLFDALDTADAFTREFVTYLHASMTARNHAGLLVLLGQSASNSEVLRPDSNERWNAIALPSLTKDELADNLRALLGAVSPSFIDVISRQSKGMPGRVEDLLNFCAGEGILEATEHGWLVHEQENLGALFPDSLAQVYVRAAARLSDEGRETLRIVAATTHPLPTARIAELTSFDDEPLHAPLAVLLQPELLDATPDGYLPAHAAVREAAEPADSALHDRFYALFSENPPAFDPDALLAHHALHSSDSARALPHLLEAARVHEERFDMHGADRRLREALALIGSGEQRFAVLAALSRINNVLGRRSDEEEFLEEMLLLAAQSNSSERLAEVYRSQAEYYLSTGEFDRARRSAEKALGHYTDIGDAAGQAWCHQKIGFTEYRTTPGESILTHYQRAQELYSSEKAALDEGNILIDIGLVYYSILKDPDKALDFYEQARVKFEAAGSTRGLTRAFGNMGAQLYALGRYEEALEHHTRANELAAQSADRMLLATSNGAMGQCELALCRYSPALLHLREELRIALEIGDGYLQEMCRENMGELYMVLGAFDEAMNMYAEAQALAEASGSTAGVAADHIDIAGCLIETRDFDGAEKRLARASGLLEQAEDVNIEAMYHYRSGYLHLQRAGEDDHAQALPAFNRLGDLADRHGFDSFSILARSYAGACQMHLGRTGVALELSREALQLLEEKGPLYGGSHDILYNHAIILRAAGESAEAAACIERAYEALMSSAESIADTTLYRSYLENVRVNAQIVRDYAVAHRSESPQALTAVREQNLRTLYAVARKINSVLDLDQLLDNIMDSALEAMNGERGLIFLIEHEQLALKVSRNVEKETIKDATEISLSILKDVLHAGKPIIVSDTSANDAFKQRESVVNFNIHSLICVPMKSKDEIIGTVYVDSRSDAVQAMSFSEIDAEFLEAFANLATIAIENARLHQSLKQENLYLRKEVEQRFGFESIIGSSPPMEKLFSETQAAIGSDGSVLIYGESGTGKELVAKAIHYNGARREHRFVAVDCGALPDTLLESELFGYKRGAFTGAVADKPGLFEEAHQGTLFLDEISNTSLAFQAKLLRVLQEGEFRRVGETKTRQVNVRIICATNKDLQVEIEESRFRQDLFYRLNVIPLTVPTLRQRMSDVPELVQHFITKYNERHTSVVTGASDELLELLKQMPWNGNVRELENLINRMIAQASDEMLTTQMLPSDYSGSSSSGAQSTGDLELSLKAPRRLNTLKEVEKEHIAYELKHTDGNKTEAAKVLGLKRTTLVEKMKKLGMM